nr:YrvL family regulatory protein [Planococcus sp. MB-3u-03]
MARGAFELNKIKTISICACVVLTILMIITFFEYIFLRVLGFQYDSIGALVFFFFLYLFLEMPLSLITNAIPKALKSVGMIQSSKGWLVFSLNALLTFALIELLDNFMTNISITWQGALIFALFSGLTSLKLTEKEKEPPEIDSENLNR